MSHQDMFRFGYRRVLQTVILFFFFGFPANKTLRLIYYDLLVQEIDGCDTTLGT